MVKKEVIDVMGEKAGLYSHAIKAGNFVFLSGQVPSPGATGIRVQTLSALVKIKNILEASGTTVKNIVKISIFLKNISDFKEMNNAYKDFFTQNGVTNMFPARSTVEATSPLTDALVEIDAIAVI